MKTKYHPQDFEAKWIDTWLNNKTYEAPKDVKKDNKKYILDMFPYPSGAGLHVGHPRGYTATDIIARFYRMMGRAVLHPMGWDAFGLPAENAAIKAKKNPMDMVPANIATFKRQMQSLGLSYDWSREFATTDPKYYGITQWLFIEFFKLGLLTKKMTSVYFCPFCKTGLAEEEVLPNGTHERCGNLITRKDMPQWLFRITTYADSLLEGLNELEWPAGILEMQRNWIGKKEGINITYKIKDSDDVVSTFTTRPETNFGATFVVLAPEHTLVKKITKPEVQEYVAAALAKTDVERQAEGKKKTGAFTGLYAINPLNGREMPVWVSDFVLSSFGTGALVGVPAHDERDFEFAKTFDLEIIPVIKPKTGAVQELYEEKDGTVINSDFLTGLSVKEALKKVQDHLEKKGWGERKVSYHLRDWIFSRQRYWGEPIPMVHCAACEAKKISWWDSTDARSQMSDLRKSMSKEVDQKTTKTIETTKNSVFGWFPIDQKTLPLELPYLKSYEPTDTGESPLANVKDWLETDCPHCGGPARRETDTMPNWAGSCWYFMAFAFWNKTEIDETLQKPDVKSMIREWLAVDTYIGGAEHAVLHLLYARFWMHVLNDIGYISFREPFKRLHNVGMILASDHRKMSKSWGNVINPDEVVAEYGADSLRMYEMFMAPFSQEISWSVETLQGVYRFLGRVWRIYHSGSLISDPGSQNQPKSLVSKLNKTIQKVSDDIPQVKFNTAIAAMMEFMNDWEAAVHNKTSLSIENAKKFLQILAPFAPFLTEELWSSVFDQKESIHLSNWPTVEKNAILVEEIIIPVQVNGKTRDAISLPASEVTEKNVVAAALSSEKVKKYVAGKEYRVIFVQGRVLNFVVQ